MVDKKSLETFLTLAKEQSFSRTAEKLNITQPAISKRISNLEQELNTQLIDRIGKQATLTHSGKILEQHALRLLTGMQDCKNAINNTHTEIDGELNLGVSHHIGLHRLPPYLKAFSQQYPKVQLNMQFVDSEQAYQLINSGELELALATLAPKKDKHIHQQNIWNDRLCFMVSKDHTLCQKDSINLETLLSEPAILPSTNTYTGKLIKDIFEQQHLIIESDIETNYLETIRMMVSIGLGWTVLPNTMLNEQLHPLSINDTQLNRELGYILHEKRTLSNAAKAFLVTITKK